MTDKDRRRKSTISVKGHSRSSTNAESGRIRLMQIIDDKNSRENFRNYLVSRYCEENLDFYMDILKFHSHFKNEILKNNEIITAANYIWNEYLDPQTSSKPLNVPQELLNQCKQKISQNSFTINLFDKLQQHCFDLMLQDSLPKFTRNSMAILSPPSSSENYLNSSSSSLSYLRPPDKQPSLRKSLSSGSLRAKMNSAIASLKTTSESTSQTTSPYISPPPSPIPPQFSSQSSASSPTSTSTFSSTSSTSSTSTTFSIPITPTSTVPITVINNQQRISMASAMSISNITKRMLLGRRNSTSSNNFSVSALSSVLYLSSLEKFRCMPGSYPCSSVSNNNNDKKDDSDNFSSTWQKLRRNISTPNFQSRPRSRSSTLFKSNNNNQDNNCNQKLPPLPS